MRLGYFFAVAAEAVLTETRVDGELIETWTERALTAEEKTQIVAALFAAVAA